MGCCVRKLRQFGVGTLEVCERLRMFCLSCFSFGDISGSPLKHGWISILVKQHPTGYLNRNRFAIFMEQLSFKCHTGNFLTLGKRCTHQT